MNEEMQRVKSGQITYAVRDTVIDDKTIKEGDIMGLGDDGLLAVGERISKIQPLQTIAALVDEDSEIISLYYGEDVSEEDAEESDRETRREVSGL